ncbi:c-type cytochrome [Thauera mechernichensis]|uniref:C-type cytochrome n=1 Tax=Thauera mechernichensis TaxID=82788 RepID=A0ABW3WEX4_9RHOO|nr:MULTISPECIES: cytochrome c [Thauera]ENO80582.1 cytochrome c, class II [Thauera sp. 27]ENO91255.1 cytochrome c, class II [Thauera sp. 28]MDG3066213.1 cytochrome c [Thauera mechernichensis]WBL64399.1 cytochrome c [Thauera sp. WB-2]HNR60861.1 cytochrome c [Thauera sp.]
MKKSILFGVIALSVAATASAQVKPEDQIKFRQAGYSFMSWNMGKIKANVEGEFNAQQVQAAANAIAAIAGSGMGALYGPGTDKDIGDRKTRAKPELFQNMEDVGKLAMDFNAAAANLAQAAASGDKAAVQKAFGETGATCKACHDKYRAD